jgi:hypothetical protein
MGNELKLNHRLRIDILVGKGNFTSLDQYLGKIAVKGFNVAGVPFRILDSILTSDAKVAFANLTRLTNTRPRIGGPTNITLVWAIRQA